MKKLTEKDLERFKKLQEPKIYDIENFTITEFPMSFHPDNFTPMKKIEIKFEIEPFLDAFAYENKEISEMTKCIANELERIIVDYQNKTKLNLK